jgi:hypothetical protein
MARWARYDVIAVKLNIKLSVMWSSPPEGPKVPRTAHSWARPPMVLRIGSRKRLYTEVAKIFDPLTERRR